MKPLKKFTAWALLVLGLGVLPIVIVISAFHAPVVGGPRLEAR
jgi:hypothetical protein